jgi:hypothetical protein
MTAIGVDTHKVTLAACAIDELGRALDEATFGNDLAGYLAFIAWAYSIEPEATIGIEGSASFGAPLARAVQSAGRASARCHRTSAGSSAGGPAGRARATRATP